MDTALTQSALIVDGLALSVTSDDLKAKFSQFGKVVWARIVMDKYGRSLGFGHVVMDNEANAARALRELNGKVLGSMPVTIAATSIPPLPHV